MERWELKILVIFLLWLIIGFCAVLPIKVSNYFAVRTHILSMISCFGGGVFFGTYLLHMAPEVRFLLEGALLNPNGIDYPLPELFTGCGFFLVLYLEKIVVTINRKSSDKTYKVKGTDDDAYGKQNGGLKMTDEITVTAKDEDVEKKEVVNEPIKVDILEKGEKE